jgi:hypothetical protein
VQEEERIKAAQPSIKDFSEKGQEQEGSKEEKQEEREVSRSHGAKNLRMKSRREIPRRKRMRIVRRKKESEES